MIGLQAPVFWMESVRGCMVEPIPCTVSSAICLQVTLGHRTIDPPKLVSIERRHRLSLPEVVVS